MDKNIEAVWKTKVEADSQAVKVIDRKFFLIPWGLISLNPGSPGFATVVRKGLKGLRQEIKDKLAGIKKKTNSADDSKQQSISNLEAMEIALDAVSVYTKELAKEMGRQAKDPKIDNIRKEELKNLSEILKKVPDKPAETLHEALQSMWIMFIGIGMDSMNDNMSVGRLDQILQPYFESDMSKKTTAQEREDYIKYVIELVGCFFMRLNSHGILINSRLAWHASGAPTATAICVGGVTPEGEDGVNDMSYIILKVTEMMCLNNPDIDVRHMPGVNSRIFLERVIEVNYITSGTPAIHNDKEVIKGWAENNPHWDIKDIRNWVACGCTEPVMHGKHFATSGDLDSSLVVPLDMALNNGNHPKWELTESKPLGPQKPGFDERAEDLGFSDFKDFYGFFKKQFEFIFGLVIDGGSHKILEAQKEALAAPLYSALLDGCIESATGMLHGGAKYNTAGAAIIGLSDVIDSLLVIKQLVFEKKKFTFKDLKTAIDKDFAPKDKDPKKCQVDGRKIYALIKHSVPKFGSGNEEGRKMADRVTRMVGDFLHSQKTGRGGKFIAGYKSASNHVVYGSVSGADASGRRKNRPYTPGLTPSPTATKNLLDNLIDVASLDSTTCENNFAFNVRFSFSKCNTYKQNIERITDYMETYFNRGGMQAQLNMVNSDTLMDAMANPQDYPDLIVRISGYTVYYTDLTREAQLEVLGRTEFGI